MASMKRPKWEWRQLRVAGDDIIGLGYAVPASKSMYESSLAPVRAPASQSSPIAATPVTIRAVSHVRDALEADQANQARKYGCVEPNAASSRFNVELPRGPQHRKYCWRTDQRTVSEDTTTTGANGSVAARVEATAPATPRSAQSTIDNTILSRSLQGTKFNMRTLQRWFRDIDRDCSGQITQREFIVALRNRPQTLKMFENIHSIEAGQNDRASAAENPNSRTADELSISSRRAAADLAREKIYRIKDMLNDIDTDGNGSMEWDEFVDFFRRAGLLLEYHTQTARNRTSLCQELQVERAVKAQKESENSILRNTMRRTAHTATVGKTLDRIPAEGFTPGSSGAMLSSRTPSTSRADMA
eukprot:TRINITY_DN7063_c0_g1_i1.p1 TRINITY_DN7063_c0_g1~~TRINITY_DN7063_c0_g1_i1.p1  ORF type:complete len:359 (-),score=50.58 TRINITY_DN7063_c0_g1_i1:93-1169(-)